MKKLRIILQSKLTVFILILITISYVCIKIKFLYYDEERLGKNEIIGTVETIKDKYLIIKDTVVYTDINDIELGNKSKCNGFVNIPSKNSNFNLFNYQNYLSSKKIYYVMNGNCEKINNYSSVIYNIKNKILKRIEKMKSRAYIKAFILGDTSDISDKVNEAYRKNGINHLFSVSGMHIGLIMSLLFFIKRKELIILFLIFYLFILNFPASMTRAVVFYIIVYINKKIELNIEKRFLFIYMMIAMLLYNPYLVYNIGFIYSYTISFFLIIFGEYLSNKNYLISTLKVSIFIFIITIPINIQTNFYLNFFTPLLNLIFIPFVSFLLFPLALLTYLCPLLDNYYYLMCSFFEKISNWFSNNLVLIQPFCKMNTIVFVCYYILLLLIINKLRFGNYRYLLFIILILFIHAIYPNFKQYGIVLTLDVGQGDSVLITYPNNRLNILVDTGGNYSSDIYKNISIPTFYSLGIKKIDFLILTHGDYDHMGEAINLVKNFKVEKVIFNCGEFNELEQELINVLDKYKIPYYSCVKELNINDNKLYFLNNKDYGNENDNSSVIYTELNNHKFLLMGDAGVEVEQELIEKYNLKDIDVLKVGHHGSKTSSSRNFIDEITPKYSIISVGKNNRYGHPNNSVLDNLEDSKIYRTDQDGSIMFKIKNNELKLETCPP